jgi:hypothetical protein
MRRLAKVFSVVVVITVTFHERYVDLSPLDLTRRY